MAVGPPLIAHGGGASVLPHDCATGCAQGFGIPEADGLALVRDADGADGRRGLCQGRLARAQCRCPDLVQVVFDVAIGGKVLRKLGVAGCGDLRRMIDHQCGDSSCTRIDCQKGRHPRIVGGVR